MKLNDHKVAAEIWVENRKGMEEICLCLKSIFFRYEDLLHIWL